MMYVARKSRRGTAYVEVLVIVAVVLGLGLLALTFLGDSADRQAEREANCIATLSCTAGAPSGGGGLGGISTTAAPAPSDPYALHSAAVAASNENGNDFKFVFAQGQVLPGGVTGKAGFVTLTHHGDNGRQFTIDIATANGTLTPYSIKGTAALLKASYGQDVLGVPLKAQGTLLGGEVKASYKADAKGLEAEYSAKADLLSAEGQVGKLDPAKSGDLRASAKIGIGVGGKFKFAIKDEDGDGYPEIHLTTALGAGISGELSFVYETTPRTAPYVQAITALLYGRGK